MTTSIITQLKDIASTAMKLGWELAHEQVVNAIEGAKESKAGQFLLTVRGRWNDAMHSKRQQQSE